MPISSPEETRAEYRAKFGTELGDAYYATIGNFMLLSEQWADYCALFGTSAERVALLNEAAPEFFGRIQNTMWDGILVTLSRLTDPAVSPPKRKNLSIIQLTELVAETELKSELTKLHTFAATQSDFARIRRNKCIAHADFEVALNRHATALPTASREKIRKSIASIRAYLETVYAHYMQKGILLEPLDAGFEADGILRLLTDGLSVSQASGLISSRLSQSQI